MNDRNRQSSGRPGSRTVGLHLGVLTAFAVSQPLFDLMTRHPPFLIAHGVGGRDVVVLTLALGLGLPLIVGLLFTWLGRSTSRWARGSCAAALTLLTAGILLPVLDGVSPGNARLAAAAALFVGMVLATVWSRWIPLRQFLTVLTPALLIFPVAFLWQPAVRQLIRPPKVSAEKVPLPEETKIVIFVLDELPATALMTADRQIDAELFPNFATLASHSTWFRRAAAASTFSAEAVPAMVTGRYSRASGEPTESQREHNLFTWLAGSAQLQVREEVTRLAPQSSVEPGAGPDGTDWSTLVQDLGVAYLQVLAPSPWRRYLPAIDANWGGFVRPKAGRVPDLLSEGRVQDLRSFIASIEALEGPQLIFYHALLPHLPWELLPTAQRYNDPWLIAGWEIEEASWGPDPLDALAAYQRLLLQTQACDRLLGELVDRLTQLGIWDQTFLVVLSDHGLSFAPDSKHRPADPDLLVRDVLHVPMLIKRPGQREGVIDDRPAQTVDLVPTIADHYGLEVPWAHDGLSLFGEAEHPPQTRAMTRVYGIREEGLSQDELQLEAEFLAWKERHFGRGVEGLRAALDPTKQLVGSRIDSLEILEPEPEAQWSLLLDSPTLLEDIDPAGPFLPAHLVGEIVAPVGATEALAEPSGRPLLAIAIEGVIRAVTLGQPPVAGRSRFSVVVPDPGFEAGASRIEALRVRPAEGGTYELTSVSTTSSAKLYEAELQEATVLVPRADERWFEGIEVLKQADLEVRDDGLLITAHGADPALLLPPLRLQGHHRLVLAIDITAPTQTTLRCFYNTEEFPEGYHRERGLKSPLRAGRNRVFLELSVENLSGRLRFDPGSLAGEYRLHSLEVYEL